MRFSTFMRLGILPCVASFLFLGLWSSPSHAGGPGEILGAIEYYEPALLKEKEAVARIKWMKVAPIDPEKPEEALIQSMMLQRTPRNVLIQIIEHFTQVEDEAEVYRAHREGGIPEDSPFWPSKKPEEKPRPFRR